MVTANQIVAASVHQNGFWVDVFTNGKNKGCVRVSCYREAANKMKRRLSMRKSAESSGMDYEAILQQNRPGSALLLRKLDRLRKIPKLMESNMRHLKGRLPKHEGFEEGLREFKGNLRRPHHLVHGVRRVGGGIKGHIDKGVGKIKQMRPGRRKRQQTTGDIDELMVSQWPLSDDELAPGGFWQPGDAWAREDELKSGGGRRPSSPTSTRSNASIASTPSSPSARPRKFSGSGSFGRRNKDKHRATAAAAAAAADKTTLIAK